MATDLFYSLIKRKGIIGDINHLKLFNNFHYSMYPARAFAFTLQELLKKKDLKYIEDLGKLMGEKSAETLKNDLKVMKHMIPKEIMKVQNVIELSGFGKLNSFDVEKDKWIIEIKEHPVMSPSCKIYGKNSCACTFYQQIYGAYIRIFNDIKNLKINHTLCMCKGNDTCKWEFSK